MKRAAVVVVAIGAAAATLWWWSARRWGGGDERRIVIAGRVLDARRRPAAKAVVVASIAGRVAGSTLSGADGRFWIDAGALPAGSVVKGMVEAADGRGGIHLQPFQVLREHAEMPELTLFLEDGGSIAVRVLENGAVVPAAGVFFGGVSWLGYGPFTTDARGMLGPRRVPAGSYLVTAFRGDALRGEAWIVVGGNEERSVDVILAPAWRLLVTVRDDATGRPVPGAELIALSTIVGERSSFRFEVAVPQPLAPTDAAGHSVLVGLPPYRAVAVAAMPCGLSGLRRLRVLSDAQTATAEPGTPELVLRIPATGAKHAFPIVADEAAGPPDGAVVKLGPPQYWEETPPPPEGRVVGRALVIDDASGLGREFLATADDGSMAMLTVETGTEAKFKRPRSLAVSARDRTGVPLAGCVIDLRPRWTGEECASATLGADGTARIGGLYPQRVNVCLGWPGRGGMTEVGTVDLEGSAESRVDLVLEPDRACVVRVTVDGERRLPRWYSISARSASVGPIEEDPEDAVLRFRLRRNPEAEEFGLHAEAGGCPPSSVVLTDPPDGGPIEGVLAFVTGAKARIRVFPPADNLHDAVLDQADPGGGWTARVDPAPDADVGRKPTELRYEGLSPGVYRARDVPTGLVSESIELAAGASADFALDLRRAGPVTVRVEGPDDADPREASIGVDGRGVDVPGNLRREGEVLRISINSEVKIRVPGDRPVTFRATHSELVPSGASGAATVTTPGRPVVLKLVRPPGATLRVRVEVAAGQTAPRIDVTATFIGSPAYTRVGKPAGDGGDDVIVRGLGPGRFSIVIFKGDDEVPVVVREVVSEGSGQIPLVLDLR